MAFRRLQGVVGAVAADQRRPDGIGLVMRRRGRAGKIVNLIEPRDPRTKRRYDVMLDDLEPAAGQQIADIFPSAGLKIVYADDVVTRTDQALAKMRPEKSRPARDHYTLFAIARVLAQQDVAPKVGHFQPTPCL